MSQADLEADLLWKGYSSFRDDAHHHEEQRARVSNLILVISAALVALAASEVVGSSGRILIGFALILLGTAGAIFSWKFYEYLTRAYERAHQFYMKLDQRFPSVGFLSARQDVDAALSSRFRVAKKLRVHNIWMSLNAVVELLGAVLIVLQQPPFLKDEKPPSTPSTSAGKTA